MTTSTSRLSTLKNNIAPLILAGLLLTLLIRTAWLSDDAYITLRTVDNFIHGYGPVWNVAERVQSYTHPLWFMLLSFFSFVTRETYLTTLIISMAITLATVWLMVKKLISTNWQLAFVGIALLFSKAFIDFSTSGLENTLTNLLLVLFLVILLKTQSNGKKILQLSLVASLLLLNRLDTAPLIAPAFAWVLLTEKTLTAREKAAQVLLGSLPLIAWEVFSLIYYGFLLPNTVYAKLSHGIPSTDLIQQGFRYFLYNIYTDPVTILLVLLGVLLPWVKRNWLEVSLSLGILLYLFYILRVGGDFMAGRFLVAPLIISVVLAARYLTARYLFILLSASTLILGLTNPLAPLYSTSTYGQNSSPDLSIALHVSDERANYYPKTGLLIYNFNDPISHNDLAKQGAEMKKENVRMGGNVSVGFVGYYAGPGVHILDILALGDPLLARMPIKYSGKGFFPGHYPREMPCGYKDSLLNNTNEICDLELETYYEKVRILTREPIWSVKRFRTITSMNLGRYDKYLEKYLAKNKP
jgi:arabinofuranosyltransferase